MLSDLLGKVEGGLFHPEEGDAVNLLTYFRAKGRQWNTVIVPGANQKLIPLPWEDIESERRLFSSGSSVEGRSHPVPGRDGTD
jgi:superfamily I DNA/RNA helicase